MTYEPSWPPSYFHLNSVYGMPGEEASSPLARSPIFDTQEHRGVMFMIKSLTVTPTPVLTPQSGPTPGVLTPPAVGQQEVQTRDLRSNVLILDNLLNLRGSIVIDRSAEYTGSAGTNLSLSFASTVKVRAPYQSSWHRQESL